MRVTMKTVTLTLAVSLMAPLLVAASNADAKGRTQSSERGGHGYRPKPHAPPSINYPGGTPDRAASFPGNSGNSGSPAGATSGASVGGASSPGAGQVRNPFQNGGSTIKQD